MFCWFSFWAVMVFIVNKQLLRSVRQKSGLSIDALLVIDVAQV